MKLPSAISAAAISIALLNAPAMAQGDVTAPDLVITGERLEQMAHQFSSEISEIPQVEDQFARWNSRICPGVVGMDPAAAQLLVDRISARAAAVGLRPGQPGCRANVMVIYAPDSDVLTQEIVTQRRDLLGYYTDEGVVTAGREALQEFAETPRAVRWWHVAQTTTADGQALGNAEMRPGRAAREARRAAVAADGGGDGRIVPASNVYYAGNGEGNFQGVEGIRSSGSRMRRETRQDLNYVLIIVDARRVADVPVSAWMDYVAMVSLAQIDPDARSTTAPSILNLFIGASPPVFELTDWDVAYLDGLYRATRDAANSRQQLREIAERMANQVSAPH
jgi:hypothetical protein